MGLDPNLETALNHMTVGRLSSPTPVFSFLKWGEYQPHIFHKIMGVLNEITYEKCHEQYLQHNKG